MKRKSKILFVTALAIVSLFVLPACGVIDTIMEKVGYAKVDPVGQAIENSVNATMTASAPATTTSTESSSTETPSTFVFTGEGDPELASQGNLLLSAIHNGDVEASWEILKYYQPMLGDDKEVWASWVAEHTFDSWTIDKVEPGEGYAYVDGTAKLGDVTYTFYLTYTLIISTDFDGMAITDMSFKAK